MPWNGDQYEYPSGLIWALVRNLEELRTAAYDLGDPNTDTAIMVWDVESALDRARLTRRQRQVLGLFVNGLEPDHIEFVLGISVSTVYAHLGRTEKKLKNFLNGCRVDTPREGYIG